MHFVELILMIAVAQYIFFAYQTGMARGRSGLQAPAVVGDEGFERMYRVQMNTLELMVAFIPVTLLAAKYWPAPVVASLGAAYIVGRHLYWRSYVKDPAKRSLGFIVSFFPIAILLLLSIVKVVIGLFS